MAKMYLEKRAVDTETCRCSSSDSWKNDLQINAFAQVATPLRAKNSHLVTLARNWADAELADPIYSSFVGGGEGRMTRDDIMLYLANHATYGRGFASTLLYPPKTKIAANDLTVFLRDVWPSIVAEPDL